MTTIPIARDGRTRCIAFEPEPINYSFLDRNIKRNASNGNVLLFPVALYTSRGTMSLVLDDSGNVGDHRLTAQGIAGRKMVEVQTMPLDDYFGQLRGPTAIKVDTQGAEPFVVAGGRRTFAKAGLLAIEFCPFLMKQLGGDPDVVISMISEFDEVSVMPGGIAVEPHFVSPVEACKILSQKVRTARDDGGDYVDILARRSIS